MAKDNAFPKKHLKKLSQEFIDATNQMSTNEVKERIISCESHLFDIAGAKEADTKLADLKQQVKEISAPYRDGKNEETAKLQYCLFVLQERGIEL